MPFPPPETGKLVSLPTESTGHPLGPEAAQRDVTPTGGVAVFPTGGRVQLPKQPGVPVRQGPARR
jgi:hypothetical protein